MEEIIKGLLSEKRFLHSIGVANLAKELAKRQGADEDKAYLAGLIHDIAKEKSSEELLEYCKEQNISIDEVEKQNPFLLHAPVGAIVIHDYGIFDEDIENAVRYHTVGRGGMSILEKIIYFADMIEPSRNYDGVEELRSLCEKDFNLAYMTALKRSIEFNLAKGRLVHTGTLDAWNCELLKTGKD